MNLARALSLSLSISILMVVVGTGLIGVASYTDYNLSFNDGFSSWTVLGIHRSSDEHVGLSSTLSV